MRAQRSSLWLVVSVALCGVPGGCKETPDTFTNGGQAIPAQAGMTYKWSFDGTSAGATPPDLVPVLGTWQVAAESMAPSAPNVLRQSATFGNPDFPRVLVKDLTFNDLRLKVRCRPETGGTDRACGLIFRAQDSDNYYVVRANALEGNVNLYHTVQRSRVQFAGASATVPSGEWSTLEVTASGGTFTVSWNGPVLFTATDSMFARGKIGLWTKADSVTAFDDLEATAQ